MSSFLFSSESVGIGHPDKVADQISDAILDALLKEDPQARVAVETLITKGVVILAGEITTKAHKEYQEICRNTLKKIGYTDSSFGCDYRACGILETLHKQSPDIAQGVLRQEAPNSLGAGDQGIMFGFACNETEELMPLPITLAHKLVLELKRLRDSKEIDYLLPDSKSQVTIEYENGWIPKRIHTVVLSTQHKDSVSHETLQKEMIALIKRIAPKNMIDEKSSFYINPTGRFVIGGPAADTGLTGRKPIVDTYGGIGRHGGGAFSGKDPTKVDRTAAYMARYIAKNIVAAKIAKRCEVQLAYAIGLSFPVSIRIDTFQTGEVPETQLEKLIPQLFDLTPKGMIETLKLNRPIFEKTAFGGHFGRNDPDFTWEKTDKVNEITRLL
jgi:S-adenosylmethionine synthetase